MVRPRCGLAAKSKVPRRIASQPAKPLLINHIARWVFRCTVVIFHVTEQQVTEVALAEYNNVVKAFPSDRTDQPFSISILPRGARRRRSIADAYRSESADKILPIGAVPVTNEIAGSLFPTA